MDLTNHVAVPADHLTELQRQADNHTPTLAERAGAAGSTFVFFATCAAAVTAGTYGWAAGMDWLDRRRTDRAVKKTEALKVVK